MIEPLVKHIQEATAAEAIPKWKKPKNNASNKILEIEMKTFIAILYFTFPQIRR